MIYAIVVDDEPHIQRVVQLALETLGCDVLAASDGEQAWIAMQDRRPDILVSDVQMANLDGIQLVERARATAEFRDMPILLLTAKAYELSQANREIAQSCTIVSKPFSPHALAAQVSRLLPVANPI